MSKSDLIDVDVQLHHETEKAVLVSMDGDEAKAFWLPRSQIEIEPNGPVHTVTAPEWFMLAKGMI